MVNFSPARNPGMSPIVGVAFNPAGGDNVSPLLPFISTWKTDNAGISASNQIRIPLVIGGSINAVIDWGDGNSDTITSTSDPALTHTYASAGTYVVSISGSITGVSFNNGGDRLKILNISQWGSGFQLGAFGNYFYGCSNLTVTATDSLNLTGATSFSAFFKNCTSITTIPGIETWNVSSIGNMAQMFSGCPGFNQSLNAWVISSCFSTAEMFFNAISYNQSMSSWVGTVLQTTGGMFKGASSFNGAVTNLITSACIFTAEMFMNATAFNQPVSPSDGTSWNMINVANANRMFRGAAAFNRPVVWNVPALQFATAMFMDAISFNSQLSLTGTTIISNLDDFFNGASSWNRADLNSLNMLNVNSMQRMLRNATSFNQTIGFKIVGSPVSFLEGASSFNSPLTVASIVTSLEKFFKDCPLFNQPLTAFVGSFPSSLAGMLQNCAAFNQPIPFDVSSVTTMDDMLNGAVSFDQDISTMMIFSCTSMVNFLAGVTLSTANYNKALYTWALIDFSAQNNVTFSGGNSKYDETTGGFNGTLGRLDLTTTYSWTITDGGHV